MRRAVVVLVVAVVVLGSARPARADLVGVWVRQLRRSDHNKLRLSAALMLARSHDPRAVAAMIGALASDPEPTVRSFAAVTIASMLRGRMSARLRRRATAALSRAARRDRDPRVRRNAEDALARLARRRASSRRRGGVFVDIGHAVDPHRRAPRGTTAAVTDAVRRVIARDAPAWRMSQPGDALPTHTEIVRSRTHAFYVAAAIRRIRVSHRGYAAEVRCAVSVRVSPWAGRGHQRLDAQHTAAASGRGRASGVYSRAGIARATRACAVAVAEEVTAQQVVPFVSRSARAR